MKKRVLCLLFAAVMLLSACNGNDSKNAALGNIHDLSEPGPGDIYAEIKFLGFEEKVMFKLFPELAPIGVEEFAKKAERGFYNNRNIHRVIEDFIIQGGSVNFDGTEGNVEFGELFDVEASPHARNFYGALALVSDEMMFNYCQFYIVVNKNPVDIDAEIEIIEAYLNGGRELTDAARSRLEVNLRIMRDIPENIKQQYLTRGGLPHLDGSVTVFGQLVSGGDVLDAIAAMQVAGGNPTDDEVGTMSKPVEEIIIEYINIIRIPPLVEEEEEEVVTTTPRTTTQAPNNDGTINIDLNEPAPIPPEEPEVGDDVLSVPLDEPDDVGDDVLSVPQDEQETEPEEE